MTSAVARDASLARAARLASGLAAGAVLALAAWGDRVRLGLGMGATLLDVAVALSFVGAALMSPVVVAQRLLVASVGAAWLFASWVAVPSLHQGVLLVTLVAFARGRLASLGAWLIAVVAVAVALGVLAQPAVAVAFAGVSVVRWPRSEVGRGEGAWYPVAAGAGVAAALAVYGFWARVGPLVFDPLVVYELVLIAVAAGHVVASRGQRVARARSLMAAVEEPVSGGVAGRLSALAGLLGDAVADPRLSVRPWVEQGDGAGHPAVDGDTPSGEILIVADQDSRPIAVVESAALAGLDPEMIRAIVTSVRLTVTGGLWQEEQDRQLAQLEGARARLVASADAQRKWMSVRLREEVLVELDRARRELEMASMAQEGQGAADALAVVTSELEASAAEVMQLVAGAAPSDLGGGGLATALRAMAARSPIPVTLRIAPNAAGGTEAETAMFYACSEALSNAIRHSAADRIEVSLTKRDRDLVLAVSDDGVGGAVSSGSGLVALADRMAACGGMLEVVSSPGVGTTLTASIPI